jgi:hypothetical protein
MPQPTLSDVHIDAALTKISVAYIQGESAYIAEKVFPSVPVATKSNKYFVYPKGDFFRDEARVRAPASESAGGGFGMGTQQYLCEVYAYHKDVDLQTRSNADPAVDPYRDATIFVTQTMMITRERQFAANYMKTGVWGTDIGGVASSPSASQTVQWNNATSDPITDVSNARATILGNTGFKPNKLVLGFRTFETLKKHPLIIDRFKYTSSASVTEAMLAQLFAVDEIVVSEAVYNTAAEGQPPVMDYVMGKGALLAHANPRPSLMMPSAGYIFTWSGYTGKDTHGVAIGTIPMPLKKADRVEGEMSYDMRVVAPDMGFFWNNIIA